MNELVSVMRAAIDRYHMIEEGDRIAVGVSGGKDSVALLVGLARLRRFYPKRFAVTAITLDPQFEGKQTDYGEIAEVCRRHGVPYQIKRTQIGPIIFDVRKEKNPCSLCARMRRGALHDAAKEAGCNKIALGHHLDDAAETFLMNLFNGGRIGCFSPVSYLSRKELTMIRPLVFAREKQVERAVNRLHLPVVKSKCPADGVTEREDVKGMLAELEKKYTGLTEKLIGAMQRGEISGW